MAPQRPNLRDRIDSFPLGFPDETFYSLICRYHRLSGNCEARQTMRDLFGRHTSVISCTLPSALGALIDVLPVECTQSVESLIEENTLLPYFRHFSSGLKAQRAAELMAGANAGGVKLLLGLVASRVGGYNPLRYCEVCCTADDIAFGQPYWHRVHQLPGVWVCPEHGSALFEVPRSWVDLRRHQLYLPDTLSVRERARAVHFLDCHRESLARIATLSQEVIDTRQPMLNAFIRSRVYRDRTQDMALTHKNGRICVARFLDSFSEYLATFPSFGEFIFLADHGTIASTADWSLRLLRKPRTAVHPLKHILLMDFLGLNFQTACALTASRSVRRTDETTVAIQSRQSNTINLTELKRLLVCRKVSLRQCAIALGASVTTVRIEATRLGLPINTRPSKLKPAVVRELCKALESGRDFGELAAEFAVTPQSFYRLLRMYPDVAKGRKAALDQCATGARRARLVEDMKTLSVRCCRDYMWLYRHDREWLTLLLKQGRRKGRVGMRVDWQQRDREFSSHIAQIGPALLHALGRPKMVTQVTISRAIGARAIIDRHLARLPLTREQLALFVETIEQFQLRRLVWEGQQLDSECMPIIRWRLVRNAGIKRVASEAVEGMISSLCTPR